MSVSQLHLMLAAVTLAGASGLASPDIHPKIAPGYVPDSSGVESGLWMEVAELEEKLQQSPLLVRDPAITNYVGDVACRVAGSYCSDLRVYVIRNPSFNASMAPNGMMQIWTGLLLRVSSEDELASVLAHELAHYLMAHTLSQFQRIRASRGVGSLVTLGIGIASGVFVPIGEVAALMDALAFSRKQEIEADVLGSELMAEAGYDPQAAYRVWENLLAEDREAIVKREEPSTFLSTHPGAEERIRVLKGRLLENHVPDGSSLPKDRHWKILSRHYVTYMDDQIETNRYGRTGFLLRRHQQLGVDPGLVEFFRGEMYRQRAAASDSNLAQAAYQASIDTGRAPAEAYRNLGYLHLKGGNLHAAKSLFRQYLELRPDASDRKMIEFYLKE